MKLSTRSRYGARILLEIARQSDGQPVKVARIADEQQITIKYLEQLIRPLKQAGMVKSIRGPRGGHLLAKSPDEITLGEVVRVLEGKSDLVECIFKPEICSLSPKCRVRLAWKEASDAMYAKLDATTIADLIQENTPFPCSDPPPETPGRN